MNNADEFEEAKCDNRRKAAKELAKQKAGKSKIKAWFYGIGNELYDESPYDKLRYKAVIRKLIEYEKKGVTIRCEYLTSYDKEKLGKVVYKLYAKKNWDISYRPFCWRWVKDIFWNISNQFKFNEHVCSWDFNDIQNYLIVNLTVKGLFLGLYGHGLYYKQQMHKIWEVRSKLIKAFNYEDYFDYYITQKVIKDKYGLNKKIVFYNEDNFINKGDYGDLLDMGANTPFTSSIVDIGDLQNKYPIKMNEGEVTYRKRIVAKAKEIDKYASSFNMKGKTCIMYKDQQKLMKEAFSLMGENLFNWWD